MVEHAVRSSVSALIRVLETAPRMPLMRDHVRIDCVEALKLVDVIAGSANAPSRAPAFDDLDRMATLEGVRQAVLRAKPIPFTDQVRLPAAQAADLADRLRRVDAPRQ